MTDRRETPRRPKRKPGQQRRKPSPKSRGQSAEPDWQYGERIAKYLARAGVASRREIEAMIERREIRVNGRVLTTPAFKVTGSEYILVNNQPVTKSERVRVWRYHKPSGLITTTNDPEGRRTIFDELPKSLPRTITIGRLDLTTEGLLLLTNDGGLARAMELPRTGFERRYRARAHGQITQAELDTLKEGVKIGDGTRYASISATLDRETGTNNWIDVELKEGKNREVRKALEHLGLKVNRLIRTQYGPFELGDLKPGAVEEIPPNLLLSTLADRIPAEHLPPPREKPTRRKRTHVRSRVHKPQRRTSLKDKKHD
ncbi:MAG: pseudouridine synthase [Henriciella sp.]|nr:pseudouridine synthase [Henriciella sp.]